MSSASKAAGETRTVALVPSLWGPEVGPCGLERSCSLAAKAALEPADTKGLQQKEDQISALQADLEESPGRGQGTPGKPSKARIDAWPKWRKLLLPPAQGQRPKPRKSRTFCGPGWKPSTKTTSLGRDSQQRLRMKPPKPMPSWSRKRPGSAHPAG